MSTPLSIAEERETYLRDDGTTFTREDVYVKLAVTFRDNMLRRLKGPKLSVFLCVALHCNRDMNAWPSTKQIQDETGYSNRAVITAIDDLSKMGLLTKRQVKNAGEYDNNRYEVQQFFTMGKQEAVVNVVHNGYEPSSQPYEPGSQGVMNDVHTKKIPYKKNISCEGNDEPAIAGCADAHDTPAPPPAEKKRSTKASDPRSKTPAIQCARGINNGRYPPVELYDEIITSLGETPDGARLAECRKAWVARGYNPNGWGWLLQWYREGIPKNGAKSGAAAQAEIAPGANRRWG